MRVGVYGLGRFGKLWAGMLARKFDVVVYNRTPREVPSGVVMVEEGALAGCDIVFLCVAIRAIEPVCERLSAVLPSGTVVADTCSVKLYPMECMHRALPDDIPIMGTHPMFGPDSIDDPEHMLPIVLAPGRDGEQAVEQWSHFFGELGLSVRRMSADEHDREAARTQGITHMIGRILDAIDLPESAIATKGYRRLRELVEQTCNDPYELFVDLWRFNPHAPGARRAFEEAVERVLSGLDTDIG